jgi:hypothetical protein
MIKKLLELLMLKAAEEHHFTLPGLDVAIVHSIKTVFIIDQVGSADLDPLRDLEDHLKKQGYFLHCIVVQPGKAESAQRT